MARLDHDEDWNHQHPTIQELARPLMPYFRNPNVTELSINEFGSIWTERIGKGYEEEAAPWCTQKWAWMFCRGFANLGLHRFPDGYDDTSCKPILSMVLPGRHRIHAVLGPSVPSGITLSIRLYRVMKNLSWASFHVDSDTATRLEKTIARGATVLVSGAMGSGKSSLLRLLVRSIPNERRVVVIGDVDELDMPQPNTTTLQLNRFSRGLPSSLDFGDMIDSVTRLNGSVTVLNELSYDNAVPALRLLNTGVLGGFYTTLHSNTPLDALEAWRRNIAMREGSQGSREVVAYLARSVDVVIHCAKTGVDRREVTGIAWKDARTGQLDVPWRQLLGAFD